MRFISDAADLIGEVKKVTITFTVEIPREEKAEEEKEKAGEEAGTEEDKAEAEGRE